MTAFTKGMVCGVLALGLGLLFGSSSRAQSYAIRSTNTAIAGAAAGDSVGVNVTGPSTALTLRSTLTLNGKNVTSALQPDGTGSMSGTGSGLVGGSNNFQMYAM